MTTKIGNYSENENSIVGNSNVIPALGESWAHATTTRILLTFDGNSKNNNEADNGGGGCFGFSDEYGIPGKRRICKLVKSSHRPAGIAYFTVTEFGLRDGIM
jgi:hypothetical protein